MREATTPDRSRPPEDPLDWMSRPVRACLDACAIRISLAQWQRIDREARVALDAQARAAVAPAVFRAALELALSAAGAGAPKVEPAGE